VASGLSRDALTSVAEAYAKSNATIVSYGMGITPAQHGYVQRAGKIANLLLLRGNSENPAPASAHSLSFQCAGGPPVGVTEKPPAALLAGIRTRGSASNLRRCMA